MSGCSNLSDKTNSTNTNINNKKETSAVSDVHTDAAADNSSSTADETKIMIVIQVRHKSKIIHRKHFLRALRIYQIRVKLLIVIFLLK